MQDYFGDFRGSVCPELHQLMHQLSAFNYGCESADKRLERKMSQDIPQSFQKQHCSTSKLTTLGFRQSRSLALC